MPYIQDYKRFLSIADNSGELNFLITETIIQYVQRHGLSYDTINDIVGALTCAQQEFYRRVAIPYEDKKIKENGDVYLEWMVENKTTEGE